jgi:DNA-directed RNA polymerase subunit RPC12/RpoP
MEFQDKVLTCIDCGAEFVFTAGEQLFFHDKHGSSNEPKRCKACKSKRVAVLTAAPPPGDGRHYTRVETRATCSQCGKETTVPFRPTQGTGQSSAANASRRKGPPPPPDGGFTFVANGDVLSGARGRARRTRSRAYRETARLRYDSPCPPIHVQNFGCRATQADGAALERQFESRGLTTAPAAQADLVILNTCTVTNSADQDARAAIRRVQRQNPWRKLLSLGCYAQRAPEEVSALPGVSCVVGNSHKHQLAKIVLDQVASPSEGFVPLASLSVTERIDQRERERRSSSPTSSPTRNCWRRPCSNRRESRERPHAPQPQSAGRVRQPLLFLRDTERARP